MGGRSSRGEAVATVATRARRWVDRLATAPLQQRRVAS
jgi:hypothetical protein